MLLFTRPPVLSRKPLFFLLFRKHADLARMFIPGWRADHAAHGTCREQCQTHARRLSPGEGKTAAHGTYRGNPVVKRSFSSLDPGTGLSLEHFYKDRLPYFFTIPVSVSPVLGTFLKGRQVPAAATAFVSLSIRLLAPVAEPFTDFDRHRRRNVRIRSKAAALKQQNDR